MLSFTASKLALASISLPFSLWSVFSLQFPLFLNEIEIESIIIFIFALCKLQVNPIVDDVRKRGDAAVKEFVLLHCLLVFFFFFFLGKNLLVMHQNLELFFGRYTWKFEKAELDKIVEVVSELPDPVVGFICLFRLKLKVCNL